MVKDGKALRACVGEGGQFLDRRAKEVVKVIKVGEEKKDQLFQKAPVKLNTHNAIAQKDAPEA